MLNDSKLHVVGEGSARARRSTTHVIGLVCNLDCVVDGSDKVEESKVQGFLLLDMLENPVKNKVAKDLNSECMLEAVY